MEVIEKKQFHLVHFQSALIVKTDVKEFKYENFSSFRHENGALQPMGEKQFTIHAEWLNKCIELQLPISYCYLDVNLCKYELAFSPRKKNQI